MSSDAVIITAAGSSKRWAENQKKEYADLGGQPVLYRTVQPFLDITPSLQIVITLPQADLPVVAKLLPGLVEIPSIRFIAGGESRQASVRLGLESLQKQPPEIVLIHDGARPWVDRGLIERVLEGTRKWGACIPVVDTYEAPKRVDTSGLILEHLPREQLKFAQTPQGFLYSRILEAHQQAKHTAHLFIDDAEVYAAYSPGVHTVAGDRRNRKITFREDLQAR